jgi:hypothetical protein
VSSFWMSTPWQAAIVETPTPSVGGLAWGHLFFPLTQIWIQVSCLLALELVQGRLSCPTYFSSPNTTTLRLELTKHSPISRWGCWAGSPWGRKEGCKRGKPGAVVWPLFWCPCHGGAFPTFPSVRVLCEWREWPWQVGSWVKKLWVLPYKYIWYCSEKVQLQQQPCCLWKHLLCATASCSLGWPSVTFISTLAYWEHWSGEIQPADWGPMAGKSQGGIQIQGSEFHTFLFSVWLLKSKADQLPPLWGHLGFGQG